MEYISLSWYFKACDSYKDFPDKRLTANKEATEPRVHIG